MASYPVLCQFLDIAALCTENCGHRQVIDALEQVSMDPRNVLHITDDVLLRYFEILIDRCLALNVLSYSKRKSKVNSKQS